MRAVTKSSEKIRHEFVWAGILFPRFRDVCLSGQWPRGRGSGPRQVTSCIYMYVDSCGTNPFHGAKPGLTKHNLNKSDAGPFQAPRQSFVSAIRGLHRLASSLGTARLEFEHSALCASANITRKRVALGCALVRRASLRGKARTSAQSNLVNHDAANKKRVSRLAL